MRHGFVADEADFLDRELVAFLDLEDEIDAIARGIDRLRLDPHVEIAALAVKRDDVLDIVVDDGARQRPAVFRLQRLLEVFVLDLLVALEDEPRNGRIFDDRHQDAIAGLRNFHVLEKPGGIQALQRRIERAGIEPAGGAGVKMRADHRRIDMPIAGDCNRGDERRSRARALASGYGEKSRKKQEESCSYRPAIHTGAPDRTAMRITVDRRGGSVTDCVEI